MRSNLITFMFMSILLSVSVFAVTDYTQTGTWNQGFLINAHGNLNPSTPSVSIASRSLDISGKMEPLASDIDNDGVMELVVRDKDYFRIYTSNTLIPEGTIARPDVNPSNILLKDINGDNVTEIIEAYALSVSIIRWNGTASTNYSINTSDSLYSNGGTMIACRGVNDCFMAWSTYATPSTNARVLGAFFNSTFVSPSTILYNPSIQTSICPPSVPLIFVTDYDVDGRQEYIFDFGHYSGGTSALNVAVMWVDAYTNGSVPVLENLYYNGFTKQLSSTSCSGNTPTSFTAPLVYNVDAGFGPMETLFAVLYDNDYHFRIYQLSSTGGLSRTFPSGFVNPHAEFLSNMFVHKAFSDDEGSFCAVGFTSASTGDLFASTGALELACGSAITGESSSYKIFRLPFIYQTQNFSLPTSVNSAPSVNIVHSAYMDTDIENQSTPYPDIITSEGILKLEDTGDDILKPIFRFGHANASHSVMNLEGKLRPQVALLTSANVYYYTDGFVNTLPALGEVTENPCFTSPIKINSTVYVAMTVTDIDSASEGDTVFARAQFYYGESFVQDSNWSIASSSGTEFPFYFTANQTVSTGFLRLSWHDSAAPSTIQYRDYVFSVAANGVSFGLSCKLSAVVPSTNTTNTTESIFGVSKEPSSNNALSQTIANTAKATGLGTTLTWYVLMIALAVFIFYGAIELRIRSEEMKYIYGLIAFLEIGVLLMGVKLGFVPVSTVIILVILGIVIVAVMASRFFMHRS